MKTLLFNPFKRYSEKELLLVGVTFTLFGSFLGAIFNGRFDGVLDLHFVNSATFIQVLLDNVINVFCLVVFLFLSAKYINRKTRLIDILTTSMVARIPYYLVVFANVNDTIREASEDIAQLVNPEMMDQIATSNLVIVTVFGLVSLLFIV